MLQPIEERLDNDDSRLVYKCRICGHRDPAKVDDEADHCVYRSSEQQTTSGGQNDLIKKAGGSGKDDFFFQVDKECVKDPTLSRQKDVKCRSCGHNEAVTFTNPTKERMNLIFVCTKCAYYWRKEESDVVNAAQIKTA